MSPQNQALLDYLKTGESITPLETGEFAVAGRRQPREFRELNRDEFEHMNLAMLARNP